MSVHYSSTIQDVARAADVSIATVSYVLSGRGKVHSRISEETAQRVRQAAKELGYVPNQSARTLRRQRTERICLILPRIGAPYYEALVRDVQRLADANGYLTLVAIADSPEREQHLIGQLRRRLADGALIVNPRSMRAEEIAPIARMGIAVVVYSDVLTVPGCDQVKTVEDEAIQQAVQYLLAKGHRRFVIMSDSSNPSQRERVQTYRRALAAHAIHPDECCLYENVDTRTNAYRMMQTVLNQPDRPTAVLAMADPLGIGALLAARDAGLDVPSQLAVIGYGNIPEDEITRPPMTTIGPEPLDFTDVAELLFSRLRGEAPSEGRVHTLTRKLILRGSA